MLPDSIRSRMTAVMLLAIMIVLGVAGTVVISNDLRAIGRHNAEITNRVVESLKQDFTEVIMLNLPDDAANLVHKIESFELVDHLVLRGADNTVVFEYHKPGVADGPVAHGMLTALIGEDVYQTSMPVEWDDTVYGSVFAVSTGKHLEHELAGYFRVLGLTLPLVLLLAVAVSVFLQNWVSRPILALRDALQSIHAEDAGHLPEIRGATTEMRQLYDGLNHMLANINQARGALEAEKERLQSTFRSISDGIICLDENGRIVYLNPAALALLACDSETVLGHPVTDILAFTREHGRERMVDPATRALWEARHFDTEHDLLMSAGDVTDIPVSVSAAPMWDGDGSIAGAVMVIRDTTEAREMERELTYQACHDELTGLINRRELERRIDDALIMTQRKQLEHVLCFLDLDQFKVVNDTCGHVAGDELLKQITMIIAGAVRETDTVARLGGDEFAILLCCCPLDSARKIAEGICQAIRDFRFVWEDKSFDLGVSIGLVEVSGKEDSASRLLSVADMACYAAKDSGRNRVWVYTPESEADSERLGEMQWVSRITQALADNNFVLYRQMIAPVIDASETGLHYEVLIRMLEPDGSTVPPGAFLPSAERYNLAPALDRWVIRNTFRQLISMPGELEQLDVCAINVSACSLADDEFLQFVVDHINATGVPPEKICFEITETSAIAHLGNARQFIGVLKELGCRFALDDFGAGMSSFAYLKNLDVDYVKIDGMFVKDILSDPIDMAMVRSINEIGHTMGIRTVAEFVESDEILAQLREIGVDYAQGFGIAMPEPFACCVIDDDRQAAV